MAGKWGCCGCGLWELESVDEGLIELELLLVSCCFSHGSMIVAVANSGRTSIIAVFLTSFFSVLSSFFKVGVVFLLFLLLVQGKSCRGGMRGLGEKSLKSSSE